MYLHHATDFRDVIYAGLASALDDIPTYNGWPEGHMRADTASYQTREIFKMLEVLLYKRGIHSILFFQV